MRIILKREVFTNKSTIGSLFVNDKFQCYTLEDMVREVKDQPVDLWKVQGKTAIPKGTYEVIISYSPRFKVSMPLLLNVPGFSGVRIHAGNKAEDTDGCILVGDWKGEDYISHSRDAYNVLYMLIHEALKKEDVHITIEHDEVCTNEKII